MALISKREKETHKNFSCMAAMVLDQAKEPSRIMTLMMCLDK